MCNQCLSPLALWVRSRSWRGVFDTILCDNVCQRLAVGRWFSSWIPVSSTKTNDRHDIAEILLQEALSTMTQPHNDCYDKITWWYFCKNWKSRKTTHSGLWYIMCSLLTLISTNKTYHHVITEILLKVALNTINQAIISFRPVILAKFDAPEYTVFIIWFHFAQWHLTYIWFIDLIDCWCITPHSVIFQLYHGNQFYWWKKPEYREKTIEHDLATENLYHLRLLVECTFFVIYKAVYLT
jgi:hypothetical protein